MRECDKRLKVIGLSSELLTCCLISFVKACVNWTNEIWRNIVSWTEQSVRESRDQKYNLWNQNGGQNKWLQCSFSAGLLRSAAMKVAVIVAVALLALAQGKVSPDAVHTSYLNVVLIKRYSLLVFFFNPQEASLRMLPRSRRSVNTSMISRPRSWALWTPSELHHPLPGPFFIITPAVTFRI